MASKRDQSARRTSTGRKAGELADVDGHAMHLYCTLVIAKNSPHPLDRPQ
jgi:hypothetical protein